jgi:predicted DNA binding CopG/RHH family protein
MSQASIPQTDSIEEMARFWDTHDLTDFQGDLEEVVGPVFERKEGTVLTIRLQPQEAEAIKRIAKSKGVKQTTLVQQWVLEKIYQS